MRDTDPILLKGTIVRYDSGSSALAMIYNIHPRHGGSVAYYTMIHCLGGTTMAYHEKLTVATGEEVKAFWDRRREWKCAEIVIDGADASELQRKLAKAEAFDTLRRIAGYVENGSDETVRFGQDDATKDWFVSVGSDASHMQHRRKSGYGRSLEAAIADFKANHPSHFED